MPAGANPWELGLHKEPQRLLAHFLVKDEEPAAFKSELDAKPSWTSKLFPSTICTSLRCLPGTVAPGLTGGKTSAPSWPRRQRSGGGPANRKGQLCWQLLWPPWAFSQPTLHQVFLYLSILIGREFCSTVLPEPHNCGEFPRRRGVMFCSEQTQT